MFAKENVVTNCYDFTYVLRKYGLDVRSCVRGGAEHICLNLRYSDVTEVWALRGDTPTIEARQGLAREIMRWAQFSPVEHLVRADNGEPVAVFVACMRTPKCAEALFLATDRWSEIARAYSRFAVEVVRPELERHGITRVEARVWDGHDQRRWVKWLGAIEECVLADYGKGGETYLQYAWSVRFRTPRFGPPTRSRAGQRAEKQGHAEALLKRGPLGGQAWQARNGGVHD